MAQHRDLDIFFRINDTKDIKFVSGNSSIVQSIKNIVLTRNGERPFKHEFGTGVLDLFFQTPSIASIQLLRREIKNALTGFEPRIQVDDVVIDYPTTNTGNGDIIINISYYLVSKEKLPALQTLQLTVQAP